MIRSRLPVVLSARAAPSFPDPRLADTQGLVAIGGSLAPEWLLAAYDSGIFPWYDRATPPLWWSPEPRAVIDPESLHVSRSARRLLRRPPFEITFDRAFQDVMVACSEERDEGTWILPEMIEAYTRLHRLGHAHSCEAWDGPHLVGGLYGVARGGLFAAESMFHRQSNAGKLALLGGLSALFGAGVTLVDVQFLTDHLASLGAYEVPRREYLARLAVAQGGSVDWAGLVARPPVSRPPAIH